MEEEKYPQLFKVDNCTKVNVMAIKDAMDVLNGSWKLPILIALSNEPKRFNQISKDIQGISDKMLSKELKDLEMNYLVKRTTFDTFPPTVQYAVTEHAQTLHDVIISLKNWGLLHRKKVSEQ